MKFLFAKLLRKLWFCLNDKMATTTTEIRIKKGISKIQLMSVKKYLIICIQGLTKVLLKSFRPYHEDGSISQ